MIYDGNRTAHAPHDVFPVPAVDCVIELQADLPWDSGCGMCTDSAIAES